MGSSGWRRFEGLEDEYASEDGSNLGLIYVEIASTFSCIGAFIRIDSETTCPSRVLWASTSSDSTARDSTALGVAQKEDAPALAPQTFSDRLQQIRLPVNLGRPTEHSKSKRTCSTRHEALAFGLLYEQPRPYSLPTAVQTPLPTSLSSGTTATRTSQRPRSQHGRGGHQLRQL